ncbi:MAG: hypothetical protein LH472_08485 [Pyrinomonadaceae bacterium]|nr:hypothetical protein [Pyrinomonadaceae bacterium]
MPDEPRKPTRIPKCSIAPAPPAHRFYFTFNEMKSAAIVIAREIIKDEGANAPPDVVRFLNECGRKTA